MGRSWDEIELLYPPIRPSTTAGLWNELTDEQLAEFAAAPSRVKLKTPAASCPCGKSMDSPTGLCAACIERARKKIDPTFRKYRQVSLQRYKATLNVPLYAKRPELLDADFPRGKSGSRQWIRASLRAKWIAAGHGGHPDIPGSNAGVHTGPPALTPVAGADPCPCGKHSRHRGLCWVCVRRARYRLDPTYATYHRASTQRCRAKTKFPYVDAPELLDRDHPLPEQSVTPGLWTTFTDDEIWTAAGHGPAILQRTLRDHSLSSSVLG